MVLLEGRGRQCLGAVLAAFRRRRQATCAARLAGGACPGLGVVPLEVLSPELLERDRAERRLQVDPDHALIGLVGPRRPRRRLDRLVHPLIEPFAAGPLVRAHELAALGVPEKVAEPVLGVLLRAFHADPLLLPPLEPGFGIRLVPQIEDDRPRVLVALDQVASHRPPPAEICSSP